MAIAENKIEALGKSLLDILENKKYNIDYFQREYKWKEKHIEQLLIDLEEAFLSDYREEDELADIGNYNSYFMGPLILFEKDGIKSIIDGQQRLTSITLLLIFINNLQKDRDDKEDIDRLIFSRKHGRNTFNIEINERKHILEKLYKDEIPSIEDETDRSIINMVERYINIKDLFPSSLRGNKLPLFIDWIKEKLIFVEIVAYSDKNAYTIFETMNDRGYNLTPSEMLKGYLLSNVKDKDSQEELNLIWREQIAKLQVYDIDEDLEFFKAWLRGKYAETIRPTIAGATNEDFEKIGTSFHRWVKDKVDTIGLAESKQFYFFIKSDFVFYSDLYLLIKSAEENLIEPLELLKYFNGYSIASSLSYPLYQAAINKKDSNDVIFEKIQIVSSFIDSFVFRRIIGHSSISQTSIRYTIYNLVKKIRDLNESQLKDALQDTLNSIKEDFNNINEITEYNIWKRFFGYILARVTFHLDNLCGYKTNMNDYLSVKKRNGYMPIRMMEVDLVDSEEIDDIIYLENDCIACYALHKRETSEIDLFEPNILERLHINKLSNVEYEILSQKFDLPKTFDYSHEWIVERKIFFLQVCNAIWKEI